MASDRCERDDGLTEQAARVYADEVTRLRDDLARVTRERGALAAEHADVMTVLSQYQPGGSPPAGDVLLAQWTLETLARERDALRAEATKYKQEADNLMNAVCSQPACRAAIVRLDNGSRVCAAGHPGRWVTIDRLTKAEARMLDDLDAAQARIAELEAALTGLLDKTSDAIRFAKLALMDDASAKEST